MNYSENYNFALPEDGDPYDISPLSENFEALDGILSENESAVEEISDKIGTPTENGQTLFSLLANNNSTGFTAIKSIQRARIDSPNKTAVLTQTVVPEKCIVFSERLRNSTDSLAFYDYTLHEDRIESHHTTEQENSLRLGFWIIEFN